jgi:hypothetical protein
MTDSNYAAICLLVDRSGSMRAIQKVAEDGINEFISGQAAQTGKRTIRLAHFDDQYQTVFPSQAAQDCPRYSIVPRGMTALCDAMGKAINEFGAELAAIPEDERPGAVIFAIMTDGAENSSREFTADAIKGMVAQQESDYNWQFMYLGANQDAVLTAQTIGINPNHAITYTASSAGTRSVLDSMNRGVAMAAAPTMDWAGFDDDDRKAAQSN